MLSSRFYKLLQIIGASTGFGNSFSLPGKARRKPLRVRDPNDPVQAARIQAAQDKRQRKATKLQRDTAWSRANNWAHVIRDRMEPNGFRYPVALDPLYVNRG